MTRHSDQRPPTDAPRPRSRARFAAGWIICVGLLGLAVALLFAARGVSHGMEDLGYLVVTREGSRPLRLTPAGGVEPFELPSPLTVRLVDRPTGSEEPTEYRLTLQEGGRERRFRVAEGETFDLDGQTYRMGAVRLWTGILPDGLGAPMASLAIRVPPDPWSPQLPLSEQGSLRIGDDTVVTLTYLFEGSPPPVDETSAAGEDVRWGVVEGDIVHWLTSFAPGSGVVLGDGRAVTLEAGGPQDGAITVAIIGPDGGRSLRVDAGTEAAGLVLFERREIAARTIRLYLIRSSDVVARVYLDGVFQEEHEMRMGDTWRVPGAPLDLHLSDASGLAVPVSEAESPFRELPLMSDDEVQFIREGQLRPVGHWNAILVPVATDPSEEDSVVELQTLLWTSGAPLPPGPMLRVGRYVLDVEWRSSNHPSGRSVAPNPILPDRPPFPDDVRDALLEAADASGDTLVFRVRDRQPRLTGLFAAAAGLACLAAAFLQAMRLLALRFAPALGYPDGA